MKKLILLVVLLTTLCNLYAQKPQIPKLENRNCSDTITLMNTKWEIVYKDTIDGFVNYTILIGWFTRTNNETPFAVTVRGTLNELIEWSKGETTMFGINHYIDHFEHCLSESLDENDKYRFCITYINDPWIPIDPKWGKRN